MVVSLWTKILAFRTPIFQNAYRIHYKDIISGDILFCDSFPIKDLGSTYEIECQIVRESGGKEKNEENMQEEDEEEAYNDVVKWASLQSTTFDKKNYQMHLKQYLRNVEKRSKFDGEEAKTFHSAVQADAQRLIGNFKDYEFYTGESMNPEAAIMLLNYREDDTPYFTVFKAGVVAVQA